MFVSPVATSNAKHLGWQHCGAPGKRAAAAAAAARSTALASANLQFLHRTIARSQNALESVEMRRISLVVYPYES